MKKALLIITCLFSSGAVYAQHDHLQTQYMMNPFVLNPACAGEQGYMSATASYRRQWVGFSGAPETFAFTLDSPIRNRHHNVGVIAVQDNIAVIHRTILQCAYAYRITGRKSFFAAGVAPGIVVNRYSWNNIQTNNPDDVFSSSVAETALRISFGLYFHSEHIFAGVSAIASGETEKGISMKHQPLHAYAGYRWGDKERITYSVSVLGRYLQQSSMQADVNATVMFRNKIGGGVSYRWKDAVAGMLQYRINEQFQVGYSYDYTTSRLQQYSSGSHELMLRYDFGYRVHASSPR